MLTSLHLSVEKFHQTPEGKDKIVRKGGGARGQLCVLQKSVEMVCWMQNFNQLAIFGKYWPSVLCFSADTVFS